MSFFCTYHSRGPGQFLVVARILDLIDALEMSLGDSYVFKGSSIKKYLGGVQDPPP